MQPDTDLIARLGLAAIFLGAAAIGMPRRLRADRAGGCVPRRVDPLWFWVLMMLAGPPVMLACLAFMVNPSWLDFAAIDAPPWLHLLGLPLAGLGLALFWWMFRHLGLNVTSTSMPRTDATLITSGPYRFIRHPMYLAALILLLAASLLMANWIVAVGGVSCFALLAARSRLEERRLIEKFGDAYREYQRTTGRFLPRLRR